MPKSSPESRTSADKPAETAHLDPDQKKALDLAAEIEHTDGPAREALTRKAKRLGAGHDKDQLATDQETRDEARE